eukprot:CAMPEP_0194073012 /NCGR_PEP_ID=MMETSP0149-20130528/581_1 /TAXON_ID=122233 /ORGANISM="Chaetoceros debilis, Strain MM31A-1" /LENGTH=576 /DNA_ID=CAMNT_0038752967 /DNA_START=64 /DNA_END=1794 /DNA_ORIENTATION=+
MGNCFNKAPSPSPASGKNAENDGTNNANVPVVDKSANGLSYVAEAAYEILRTKHKLHHKSEWNVTKSKVVGALQHTPGPSSFASTSDPEEGHSDWFAEKMCEIMSLTTKWCDVMSLGAPDGLFLEKFQQALQNIAAENKKGNGNKDPIVVRFMFGNIIGVPINCNRVMKKLTEDLPEDANLQVWVGAWRYGASWNHAKLIAVDGKHLQTGGHNVWSDIYLKDEPVHDISIQLEGDVTIDAHNYADTQWKFIEKKQGTIIGQIMENIPDFLPMVVKSRVIVSEYPRKKANEFPPYYDNSTYPADAEKEESNSDSDLVSVISVGRQGALVDDDRPADDAFIAMIDASTTIIRMSLQDIGPITLPGLKIPLPSVGWPKPYMDALARAIWLRGVDVEIVLSNEDARGGYTNGWDCCDVGSEIIKRIKKQFPDASDVQLRQKVDDNLRICFIRHGGNDKYESGKTRIGNHTKWFIVDDLVSYTGSQNLYECDLAEWGVLVDDAEATADMISYYWKPMWDASFVESDCEVQRVMDGLDINRENEAVDRSTEDGKRQYEAAASMIAKSMFPQALDDDVYDKEE